jgi:hypothetical protein
MSDARKAIADVFADAVTNLSERRRQLREYEAKFEQMLRSCTVDCDHPDEEATCRQWIAETRRRLADAEVGLLGQVGVASARGLISDVTAETLREFFTPRTA